MKTFLIIIVIIVIFLLSIMLWKDNEDKSPRKKSKPVEKLILWSDKYLVRHIGINSKFRIANPKDV